jgi:hypothetical protein
MTLEQLQLITEDKIMKKTRQIRSNAKRMYAYSSAVTSAVGCPSLSAKGVIVMHMSEVFSRLHTHPASCTMGTMAVSRG